jgi:hypothetical protein
VVDKTVMGFSYESTSAALARVNTMGGIYAKDMLDAVLSVVAAQQEKATYARVVTLLAEAIPERRLMDTIRELDAAVKKRTVLRIENGFLILTPAGRTRIATKRCPEGLPQAVILAAYAHEKEDHPRAYRLDEQHILAIIASYDDPLTVDEILDDWERRHGDRPNLEPIIDALYADDTLAIANTPDDEEPGYIITNDGMDRYEEALSLLIPRASLRRDRTPMFLAFADIRQSSGDPILSSRRVPHRVREAIENAAQNLIDELCEATNAFDNDLPDGNAIGDLLPQFFIEKYDTAFLIKFTTVVVDVLNRLRNEREFRARSVAEALTMRDIMNHAKQYLSINSMSGLRPPSQRESRFFIYIDSQIFDDRFFEMLFSDLSATIYAVKAEENPNLPDISFATWFEPFKDKKQRINDRDREAAQEWLAKMEIEIYSARSKAAHNNIPKPNSQASDAA